LPALQVLQAQKVPKDLLAKKGLLELLVKLLKLRLSTSAQPLAAVATRISTIFI